MTEFLRALHPDYAEADGCCGGLTDTAIRRVLDDPAASDWLKRALRLALDRDAVDAAHDAEVLADLLRGRCAATLGLPGSS